MGSCDRAVVHWYSQSFGLDNDAETDTPSLVNLLASSRLRLARPGASRNRDPRIITAADGLLGVELACHG